jgi:hypothetical protein
MCECAHWVDHDDGAIYIDNKSGFAISFYFPLVGMEGGVYPDTTLFLIPTQKSIYENFYIESGEGRARGLSNITVENWILTFPKDTVSIYIFEKDTLKAYTWEEIQRDYKILQRYDLSIEDLKKLSNEDDIPIITYPPTEAMKDMKMYPLYQKLVAR